MIEIDWISHARFPRAPAPSVFTLVNRLIKSAPADLDATEKRALRETREAAIELQEVRKERDRYQPARVRPVLGPFGAAWTSLLGAIDAKSTIPSDVSERGPRAAKLKATLFANGTEFLSGDADSQWFEASSKLARIDEEDLDSEIASLIGEEHLDACRKATSDLAETLGLGHESKRNPSTTALANAIADVARCAQKYVRILAAKVDERDEASVQRFVRAVEPLETYRSTAGKSREETPSEEPSTPEADPPIEPAPEA